MSQIMTGKIHVSEIIKERIDNFELDTFVSDMIEYGQAVRQVQHCPERGIVVTTPKNGCFNAMQAAIFAQSAIPIQPIQVISRDEYKKQYTPDLDLPLEYDEDFEWDYKNHKRIVPKIKTEVDNKKIQQAICQESQKVETKGDL